jgi:tetratricopeptide (TPR) repeat protein
MKFLFFLCSLTGVVSICFSQDPMLDMDMLFPERATITDNKQVSDSVHVQRRDTMKSLPDQGEISIHELQRRIERLEMEMESLKKEVRGTGSERNNLLPSVDQQLYARALRHFTSGEYGKAAELLRKIRNDSRDSQLNLSALYWLGECAFRMDNFNESVVLLQELVSEESDLFRENALILIAVSFRKLGKDKEAVRYFKRYLEEFPDSKYSRLARRELEKNQ